MLEKKLFLYPGFGKESCAYLPDLVYQHREITPEYWNGPDSRTEKKIDDVGHITKESVCLDFEIDIKWSFPGYLFSKENAFDHVFIKRILYAIFRGCLLFLGIALPLIDGKDFEKNTHKLYTACEW